MNIPDRYIEISVNLLYKLINVGKIGILTPSNLVIIGAAFLVSYVDIITQVMSSQMASFHLTCLKNKFLGPISLVFALREGLSVVAQEGIENVVSESHFIFIFQFRQHVCC